MSATFEVVEYVTYTFLYQQRRQLLENSIYYL